MLWSPFLSDTFGKLEEILATSTSDWGGNSLIIEKGYVRRTCMRGGGAYLFPFPDGSLADGSANAKAHSAQCARRHRA